MLLIDLFMGVASFFNKGLHQQSVFSFLFHNLILFTKPYQSYQIREYEIRKTGSMEETRNIFGQKT